MVNRHGDRHELSLVPPALGKQRTDRPVDQARRQRRLLARTALALEKRAGNLPGGVHPLLDIDGQRKEVNLAEIAGGRCTQDHRVARADDDGAGGLLGQLACFERDLGALDLDGHARNGVRHIFSSLLAPPFGRRSASFLFFFSERTGY